MNSEQKYVLYADDDADDRETFVEMMRSVDDSLSVMTVENGRKLLDFLNSLAPGENFPCFVIVDMNMPVMNGFETLIDIKSHPVYRQIPVVIFTTSSTPDERQSILNAGGEDVLIKPAQVADLEYLVKSFATFCHAVEVQVK